MRRPVVSHATLALAAALAMASAAPLLAQQPAPATDGEPRGQVASSDDPDAVESSATRVPLDEIRRYVNVFNAVKEAYVEPVEDKRLMQSAIRGLLLDLDPHSAYLERDAARVFDEGTSGAYDGIGVEVLQLPDGTLRVVSAIDDTPAARAGLRSGDVVVAINGEALRPTDGEQAALRGKPGSEVVLTVVRAGVAEPLQITIRRERIRVASVRGRMLEPGNGYIRVAAFQADTAADFQRVLARLQAESASAAGGSALRGLVLDLRSNPGGLLTSAVQIADDLLDKGGIVSTRGRIAISDAQFSATPGDLLRGAPVVVLVDAGSASASEVLAGALHDNGRARVVGSRTFGKGSVQTLLPLDNGDAIKLTTARYYTPRGTSIQARGIVPDVVLQPGAAAAGVALPRTAEATLPGHLAGESGLAGEHAGDVLDGEGPVTAALEELRKMQAAVPAAAPRR